MVNQQVRIISTQGNALYEAGVQNGAISSSASAFFFTRGVDLENKQKYGSFNNLEIVNNSTNTLALDLDGQTTRRRVLFGKASIVIKPDQNIFFDTIKLTDLTGANIDADTIALIARIVR